jgi:hypothetical protein
MKILDIARGESEEPPTAADGTDGTDDAETAAARRSGRGRRRWLAAVLVGLGAFVLAVYLRSRRRAAREAAFTEIELDAGTDPESGSGSESASESESTTTE